MFRLEKLEISGFKSFADRTSLVFGEGITGVVGPNGCGKSNIAEAISWVLGEQSAKNLRGGKMEDVIFNGTRDRKPVGMAEVLLTLVAIEDIAERDIESSAKDEESEYDEAVESAERAAHVARSLVEEMTRAEQAAAENQPPTSESDQTATGENASPATNDNQSASQYNQLASQAEQPANGGEQPSSFDNQSDDNQPDSQKVTAPDRIRQYRRRKRKAVAISAGERITVGRRLYRTGDSEYLMNGRSCLLRDIQDLFAGTGLGGAHYAIIEQGRIGQILSSKPLDRRALIEEAAGITKFKSRKRAAELKLESAKQNLTRLNDIISEVERQVNSLKRQAQKARRYRRLRDEMRGLQKLVFTADYHRLTQASERIAKELEEAGLKQSEIDARLSELESEHRVASTQARAAEDDLTKLREQAASNELEADRARNRRAFEQQQIKELTARIEELERDQLALDNRLALLADEAARQAADLKSLEAELTLEQADLLKRESQYQAEMARLREAESEIEQMRQRMLTEIGATERLRNLGASLEEGLRRLDLRESSLKAELERAAARRDEASNEHGRVAGEVESNRARLAALSERITERAMALQTIRGETTDIGAQIEATRTERASADHRLASLEDLDAHHAYYSDAVRQVLSLEQAARINALGTLADFVEVEPQYERLVESLFGRELQSVLVPTIDDALAGVDFLKAEGLGRGAFLVVGLHGGEGDSQEEGKELKAERRDETGSQARQPAGEKHRATRGEESRSAGDQLSGDQLSSEARSLTDSLPSYSVTWPLASDDEDESSQRFHLDVLRAIDLLEMRSEIKSVVERAFPEKCAASVVPEIEAALQLSIENPSRIYVTLDGEQVVNGRLIVTGAQAGQKGTSLLGLKREIKQLRVQAELLREEEETLSRNLSRARTQLEQIESEAVSLDAELHQHEKAIAARDSQLEGLTRDLERAQQHVRVVETEMQQAAEERAALQARVEQLKIELQNAEASRDSVQQSLATAQIELVEMRAKVEQFSEQLSSARASVAARAERRHAAVSELRRTENEAEELRSRINRNRLELYDSHNRVEQLTASHAEGDSATLRFDAERLSLAEQVADAAETLAGSRARTDELEAILSEMRQAAAAAHDRRGQVEVERARVESEAEHLLRTCFSELGMPLEEVIASVEAEQNQAAVEVGQIEETVSASAEENNREAVSTDAEQSLIAGRQLVIDMEAARGRLDELRVSLDAMGPVNMMALEELEEAEERFKFLSAQRRDILDSIDLTEEALAEIKRRSRERFRHAFTRINENFQRMFVELFGGGRGEMILIDEDDILESGIDLIAQPPGKRLQNVLLLSGGEKAMAAIALVLAIFQYRPSPFCLLDEVDAPLDEINVGRFAVKVIEMSQETQFLVITHNKRTMESARALYGITMEEPGISKLVSVKFE